MARSQRPRLRELRDVYLLVGECCALGADPIAWRRHMVEGLMRVLGAQVGIYAEGVQVRPRGEQDWLRPLLLVDVGWPNASDREPFELSVREAKPETMPWFSEKAIPSTTRLLTCRRPYLIEESEWHSSATFNEYIGAARLDDFLWAHFAPAPGQVRGLLLHRALHEKPFEERQRRLLGLFWHECAQLLGTKLTAADAPSVLNLPPRLREVLFGLLEGDSEKQLALRLTLSPHTVHDYVKQLHQRFDACSRGELLAKCREFWPVLHAAEVSAR